MNQVIETLIQEIGNHILDLIGDDNVDVIAYSEIEHNVVTCSIFYRKGSFSNPTYIDSDHALSNLFYSLWLEWKKDAEDWRAVCYSIIDGGVGVEIVYKDKFNVEVDTIERSNQMVEKYFRTKNINYPTE